MPKAHTYRRDAFLRVVSAGFVHCGFQEPAGTPLYGYDLRKKAPEALLEVKAAAIRPLTG